jgi:hypothetical protein
LKNSGQEVYLPDYGDISVYDQKLNYTFEIGGKDKQARQLNHKDNSFIIADDIKSGFRNKIPLYLLGFLY